jgi:hypothetical protein
VVGGNKQGDNITKEDVSSPTVSAEAVMLICVIDAVEGRDVATLDVPNAFVQTVVEYETHRVIICIRGPLVDMLVSIAPEGYGPYVSRAVRRCCLCNEMLSMKPWWQHYCTTINSLRVLRSKGTRSIHMMDAWRTR